MQSTVNNTNAQTANEKQRPSCSRSFAYPAPTMQTSIAITVSAVMSPPSRPAPGTPPRRARTFLCRTCRCGNSLPRCRVDRQAIYMRRLCAYRLCAIKDQTLRVPPVLQNADQRLPNGQAAGDFCRRDACQPMRYTGCRARNTSRAGPGDADRLWRRSQARLDGRNTGKPGQS